MAKGLKRCVLYTDSVHKFVVWHDRPKSSYICTYLSICNIDAKIYVTEGATTDFANETVFKADNEILEYSRHYHSAHKSQSTILLAQSLKRAQYLTSQTITSAPTFPFLNLTSDVTTGCFNCLLLSDSAVLLFRATC